MSDQPQQPPQQPPRADYQRAAQDAMSSAKAAAQDALGTFMKLIYNPVGALPEAYRSLAPTQAIGVGVVFAVVAVVCLMISGQSAAALIGGLGIPGFKGFLLGLGTTLGMAAGIALGSWLCRLLLRGEGNLAFDIFIGGAALLPIGIGVLVSYLLGVIGIGFPIGALPTLVGFSLTILVIFTGLGRIAGIKEGLSSYLVAAVLAAGLSVAYLVARILGKILF